MVSHKDELFILLISFPKAEMIVSVRCTAEKSIISALLLFSEKKRNKIQVYLKMVA